MEKFTEIDAGNSFASPIDINIHNTQPIEEIPELQWYNYSQTPAKMKVSNSGHTVILSGKWGQCRPYVGQGPLPENGYVFSQMHFHWGEHNDDGSEHTVEGARCPMEMHVVHFKSSYLTQESALTENDGMITMVYFFKLQPNPNPGLTTLVNALDFIKNPQVSAHVNPIPLSSILIPFQRDYFLYWGAVNTTTCSHLILWFICREPIGISIEQLNKFRKILDIHNAPMMRNYRDIQPSQDAVVFHVLPSGNNRTTLLRLTQSHQETAPEQTEEKRGPPVPPGMIPKEITAHPVPVFVPVSQYSGDSNPNNGYVSMTLQHPFNDNDHGEMRNSSTSNDNFDPGMNYYNKQEMLQKKLQFKEYMHNLTESAFQNNRMYGMKSLKDNRSRMIQEPIYDNDEVIGQNSKPKDTTHSPERKVRLPYDFEKFQEVGLTEKDLGWTYLSS